MHDIILNILSSGWFLVVWGVLVSVSVVILIQDLIYFNNHLVSLMKCVWIFTIIYSGPFGLGVYFYSGRKQIKQDSLWLAGKAGMSEPLFWSSLVFSLSVGLVAAYPVNVLLIHLGINKGMHNPKHAHNH